jgi:hypothetical protein
VSPIEISKPFLAEANVEFSISEKMLLSPTAKN